MLQPCPPHPRYTNLHFLPQRCQTPSHLKAFQLSALPPIIFLLSHHLGLTFSGKLSLSILAKIIAFLPPFCQVLIPLPYFIFSTACITISSHIVYLLTQWSLAYLYPLLKCNFQEVRGLCFIHCFLLSAKNAWHMVGIQYKFTDWVNTRLQWDTSNSTLETRETEKKVRKDKMLDK